MNKIQYRTPAKIIFSGEHAVVYGKPALVSAIGKYLTFSVWEGKKEIKDPHILFVVKTVQAYLKKKKIEMVKKNYDYLIESTIPIGRGLGSSAAFSVASAAAFLEFFSGKQFEKEEINNIAYQIEKQFHSRPSGADTSASCFGGLIYFRKEFEFLKTISNLHIKIPKIIEEDLYLIDSGKPSETTSEMVEIVGREYNRDPKRMDFLFSEIEKTTKRLVVSLVKEDKIFFQKTIIKNELLLEKIGVVSKQTKQLLIFLKNFGVGKMTGAGGRKGGSGYIMFYNVNKANIEEKCKELQLSCFKFISEEKGVLKL